MKKRISRKQLLTGLTTTVAGVGLLGLRRCAGIIQGGGPLYELIRTYLPFVSCESTPTPEPATIQDYIRQEALAPNRETYHPLPLSGSWNAATWWNYNSDEAGFSPSWQLEMIRQGRHFLPWFNIPDPDIKCEPGQVCYYTDYLGAPLQEAASLNLPISFVGTQWEHYLYDDPAYSSLPPARNPNVVSVDGTILKKISPFGPVEHWYAVGSRWGASPMMQQVISWYPHPPLAIFASNNEAVKLWWPDAETDQHYLDLYGAGRDDDFKRQVFAGAWKERYTALIRGFRDGLRDADWQAASRFVGYEAFGPGYIGRWGGWKEYSLYVPDRIDPHPLFWEGGSPALYIWATHDERDNNVQGPLFQAMNWVFILEEAHRLRPSFWYEFSTWDEDEIGRRRYAELGQSFTPERYAGFVQFAMWLVRPRLVREYRDWDKAREAILPWANQVFDAVDRVYANATLRSFWRDSTLVANPCCLHPYQADFPPEYLAAERMFLLSTDQDPAGAWSLDTEFPVMSLARVKGASPNRQWLLYAYAPLGARTDVTITIPDYRAVTVNVPLSGTFYLVNERATEITRV